MKAFRYVLVCVLFCALLSLCSLADDGYEAALGAVAAEVKTGEEAVITVGLSGGSTGSFAAAELNIAYDSSRLRFESADPEPSSVSVQNGLIRLVDYGEDKSLGAEAYTLRFTALKKGSAEIRLKSVRLGTRESAKTEDLRAAVLTESTLTVVISPRATYRVILPDEPFVSGADTVDEGDDYTLTVDDYDRYDYEVTATMAGESVEVIDRGDGRFTVRNVTGELMFAVKRTEKPSPTPTPEPTPPDKPAGGTAARTGDAATPVLWLALCIVCGAAIIAAENSKRKKATDRN